MKKNLSFYINYTFFFTDFYVIFKIGEKTSNLQNKMGKMLFYGLFLALQLPENFIFLRDFLQTIFENLAKKLKITEKYRNFTRKMEKTCHFTGQNCKKLLFYEKCIYF